MVARWQTRWRRLGWHRTNAHGRRKRDQRQRGRSSGVLLWSGGIALGILVAGVIGTTLGLLEAKKQEGVALTQGAEARKQEAEARKQERLAKGETAAKEQARAAEQAQRERAETATDEMLKTLDTMVSDIAGDSLTTQKAITPQQKKLLDSVLPTYRKFAAWKGGDEKTRDRVALAAFRTGIIEIRLGRREEGIAAFRAACADFAKLSAEFPRKPDFRRKLALSHDGLGSLFDDLGQAKEAQGEFEQAMEIQRSLVADFPRVPDYAGDQAMSHLYLGRLQKGMGQWNQAKEHYEKALQITDALSAEHPAVPRFRNDLARSYAGLG